MFIPTETICAHTFLPGLINADSLVLDLGANNGEFSHGVIELFGCRVIAAEPLEELCAKIRPHPLLQLHTVAVGGRSQNVVMNLFPERCASFLSPVGGEKCQTTRSIPMMTLAEFRRLVSAERADLLKVDIEGSEIDLFGASQDDELRGIMQIAVEFHDFLYREQHESVLQIRERLSDIGFWVVPFSLDNSNVLFVNRATGISAADITYLRTVARYVNGLQRRVSRVAAGMGFPVRKH